MVLLIPVIVNVPLYAEFATPAVLFVLIIFRTSTCAPIVKSWGSSVIIFAVPLDQFAFAMNLGFLNSVEFVSVAVVGLKYLTISVVPAPIVLLDSWMT